MSDRSEIRRQLYENARKAFAAADNFAQQNPKIGTPEWELLKALWREALAANTEYLNELKRDPPTRLL